MAIKTIKEQNLTWVYIDEMNPEALEYIKTNYNFHPLDFEDLREESQTPKIDAYKNYLFAIFHFPHWQAETKTVVPSEIDMFIGENYLITIQYGKTKEMKKFFYRCLKSHKTREEWMGTSSGFLLHKLVEALFHHSQPILDNIGKQISIVEESVFLRGQADTYVIRQLALHRRNILNFRRIIDPQRYLVSSLSHTRRVFLDETLSLYFDNTNDYLSKIWSIIDTYKDTIDGLHTTVESLLNRRTNKLISTLTTISVSLMPLTLLSGMYGMNISNLPFATNPIWVWLMFLVLALAVVLFVLILKRKKLL